MEFLQGYNGNVETEALGQKKNQTKRKEKHGRRATQQ